MNQVLLLRRHMSNDAIYCQQVYFHVCSHKLIITSW